MRLIFEAKITDPLELPEKRRDAEEQLDEFVKIHLPMLEDAHSVYMER